MELRINRVRINRARPVLQFIPVQWRIYIVKFWTRPSSRSIFLHFHAVFGNFWPNNWLALHFRVGGPSWKSWRIQSNGHVPIAYPNSFILMQFPEKILPSNRTPSSGKLWVRHCRLLTIYSFLNFVRICCYTFSHYLFHGHHSFTLTLSGGKLTDLAKQSNRPWQAWLRTGVS